MKLVKNYCLLLLIGTLCFGAVHAQNNNISITGSFKEKVDAEISVFAKSAKGLSGLMIYKIDKAGDQFAFSVPYIDSAKYFVDIAIMKMGHMRLEVDKRYRFPVVIGQNNSLNFIITPSILDTLKKTGFVVENTTATLPIATIKGVLKSNFRGGEIGIQKVNEGRLVQMESVRLLNESSGAFNLQIPVFAEGFYYISTLRWQRRIYLKPGDDLQLIADAGSGNVQWIKYSEENNVVKQWDDLIKPITNYGYYFSKINPNYSKVNIDSFAIVHQQLQQAIEAFASHVTTNNTVFNNLFPTVIKLDNHLTALNLLYYLSAEVAKSGFRMQPKEFQIAPASLHQFLITDAGINNTKLLKLGEGDYYIKLQAKYYLASKFNNEERKKLTDASRLHVMLQAFSNDTLQSFLLKNQIDEIEVDNLRQFNNIFLPYKKYAFVPSTKEKYEHLYHQFAADTAYLGKPILATAFPDINNKPVSLTSFKGKVVFIDTWATWCGPCKAQVPFLKEIQEEYKNNKELIFVGISIDRKDDTQKWKDMVKKEELEGIQLIDDTGKSFAKPLKILAVPRFLIIDKKGNWFEVNCPKPENKEKVKSLIDEALSMK